MTIREQTQAVEQETLSEYASLSCRTKGRLIYEVDDPIRTPYQRDRDRIIHCNSFRRLKRKTQVFLSPEGDHYRTRLTHTLEVSQIARTIAVALRLNESLTEAIALGHDLGHTPFGHAGERVLDSLTTGCGGFKHYRQSLRVVDTLEKDGKGLNLCFEVRDGILHHTKAPDAATLEGRIVYHADHIAYINHDIEDAVRAGVLREEEIPKELTSVLGNTKSERITNMINAIVYNSGHGKIVMDSETEQAYHGIHDFLLNHVYRNSVAKDEEKKVPQLIETLFEFYCKHIEKLPDSMQIIAEKEGAERAAADYIAGMTDDYAVRQFEMLYIPRFWQF